jgi:hypothetical protein
VELAAKLRFEVQVERPQPEKDQVLAALPPDLPGHPEIGARFTTRSRTNAPVKV